MSSIKDEFIPDADLSTTDYIYDDDPSAVESFGRGLAQDVSFGFGDEIAGAIDAAGGKVASLFGGEEVDFLDEYERSRDESREANRRASEVNPTAYTAGELTGMAGGMFLGTGLAKAGIKSAAKIGVKEGTESLGKQIAKGVGTGAGFGAASGAGFSESESLEGTLVDTISGAKIGAAVGGALPVVAKGFSKLGKTLGNLTDEESRFIKEKPEFIQQKEGPKQVKTPEDMKDDIARRLNILQEEVKEGSGRAKAILSDPKSNPNNIAYEADDIVARIEVEELKLVDTYNIGHIEPTYKSRQKYLDDMVKASEKKLDEINGEVYKAQQAVESSKVSKIRKGKEIKRRTPGKIRKAFEAAEEKRWQADREVTQAMEKSKSYKAAYQSLKDKQDSLANYSRANKEYISKDMELKELELKAGDMRNIKRDIAFAENGYTTVGSEILNLNKKVASANKFQKIIFKKELQELKIKQDKWAGKIQKKQKEFDASLKSADMQADPDRITRLGKQRTQASDDMRRYADEIKESNQTIRLLAIDVGDSELAKLVPKPVITNVQNQTAYNKLANKRKSFEGWEEPITPGKMKELVQKADEEAKWSKDPYPQTYQKSIQNLRIATDQQLLKKDFPDYAIAMEPISLRMEVMEDLASAFKVKQERIGKEIDTLGNVLPIERTRGFVGSDQTIAQIKKFKKDKNNKAYKAAQKYDNLTTSSLVDQTTGTKIESRTLGGQPAGSKSVVAGTTIGATAGGLVGGTPGAQVGGFLGAGAGLMHDKYSKYWAKQGLLAKGAVESGARKLSAEMTEKLLTKISPKFRGILQKAMNENGEKALWATHFLLSQRDPKYREESKKLIERKPSGGKSKFVPKSEY